MENKIKVMADLKERMEENVRLWNEAYIAKNMENMLKADKVLTESVKEYSEVAQALCFHKLKESSTPMLDAIKKLSFTTLKVKENRDNETGINSREIVEKDQQIDLLKFDNFCKGGIANDPLWQYVIQRFNLLMCLRAARELKIDPKTVSDSYFMAEKAKEIELGKSPDSNTQILKQLQMCIDAVIYEKGEHGNIYKATSKDVAYLIMLYTKKGKAALSVATAKHSNMRGIITEVLHRIVTEKEYSVEYKTRKK